MAVQPIWVTWMECFAPPAAPRALTEGFKLVRERLGADEYLSLYRLVGEQSDWDLRFKLSQPELSALLASPKSHVTLLKQGDAAIGLCEFELLDNGQAELQHFGLAPEFHGKGLAQPFLENALNRIFSEGATRVWLHTDEWDSPAAQKVYTKAGFTIYDRKFMDPTQL
jgi:ribosomal protein S18 acetylase RimI-like enzyme